MGLWDFTHKSYKAISQLRQANGSVLVFVEGWRYVVTVENRPLDGITITYGYLRVTWSSAEVYRTSELGGFALPHSTS